MRSRSRAALEKSTEKSFRLRLLTPMIFAPAATAERISSAVRLHERGETEFVADGEILRERLRVQQRADQQHAVRAHQAGLIELVVADGEVLAQHRR